MGKMGVIMAKPIGRRSSVTLMVLADLGDTFFDDRARTSIEHRHLRPLERLGLKVSVEPLMPATKAA